MKKIGVILGVFIVVVLLLVIGLAFFFDANRFRPELESELSKVLGRQVGVGDLKLSIFGGSVSAGDLTISEDPKFGSTPFLKAKSLNVGAELIPLIMSRKLDVTGITIDQPEIVLLQSPSGAWNFSTLGNTKESGKAAPPSNSGGAPLDLSVKSVHINKGRVTMGQTGHNKKPLILEKVDVVVKDFSPASQFPFSVSAKVFGGGDVKLDGKAGPIHPAAASMTPFDATLKISSLDFAGSGLNSMAPEVAAIISMDGKGASA